MRHSLFVHGGAPVARARAPFFTALGLVALVAACGGATTPRSEAKTREPAPAPKPAETAVVLDKTAIAVAPEEAAPPPQGLAKADEPPTESDGTPRIGALGPHTWIYRGPAREGLAIGKLRPGTSVRLKSPDPIEGPGCKAKWYAIEPRGYVCADSTATLNLADPYYKVLAFSAPAPGTWPYRYGHANGSPMYSRVPTEAEWEKEERGFGPVNHHSTLGAWAKGHEELIDDTPIVATDEVPYFLRDGKRTAPGGNFNTDVLVWRKIPAGSMLSYSRAFEMNGRVWLLTPDTMIVPADRVSQQRRTRFHGVHLDEGKLHLPFAWNRSKSPVHLWKREGESFAEAEQTLDPKSPIEITDGPPEKDGAMEYFAVRGSEGIFVQHDTNPKIALDNPITFTRAATKIPQGIAADEKWIEVKIVPGTLTAYVGSDPVFSTLFSPGKGGPPAPGHNGIEDARHFATTSTGFFPLEWKEHVATMSNEKGVPKVLWFSDVPNQQYLKAPLAMHVAYWHEDFGIRKSAECVNVAPLDGQFLFGWTLPQLPEGWNAVGAGGGNGKSTPVVVTAN